LRGDLQQSGGADLQVGAPDIHDGIAESGPAAGEELGLEVRPTFDRREFLESVNAAG
jgi:hypothetical protein